MLIKRGFILFLSFLIVSIGIWYFFFKKYDYQVSYKVAISTGGAFHKVAEWKDWHFKPNKSSVQIVAKRNFNYLSQHVSLVDTSYTIDWSFTYLDESNTEVTAGIIDHNHSILNRFYTLIRYKAFELDFIDHIYEIGMGLTNYAKTYKVDLHGIEDIIEVAYVYIPLKSTVQEKANDMIANNYVINTFLADNNTKIYGKPFVKVNKWNPENDSIQFDFCFPVQSTSGLADHLEIKIGKLEKQNAFKAVFFGNYSKSHEAWFDILDHAANHQLVLNSTPIEFFHNNPYDGGDEMEWKAEVFFPIQ